MDLRTQPVANCAAFCLKRAVIRNRELFDGQKGVEACMDTGRSEDVEVARTKEDTCWSHRKDLKAV